MIESEPSSSVYANLWMTPKVTLRSYPGTAMLVLFTMSMWSTSRSEIAVRNLVHQLTSLLALKIVPLSYRSTNECVTALALISSIVKKSLDQSTLMPIFRNWSQILPPYSSFHSKTFSRNFSLPRSYLVMPCFINIFSTTD